MPDSRSFRQWFGSFATGITVVTAQHPEKGSMGITINSVTSVSLKPSLILFCLDQKAHIYPLLLRTKKFAINVLSQDQENVSRHFADYRRNPAPKDMWGRAQDGCPILSGTLGWMTCRRIEIHKGGDHDIVVAKSINWHKRSGNPKPLLYFHGRYRKIVG